jgi:hypothetical protein
LTFAEPLTVLPKLWYLLHDLDDNKKTVADYAANFTFFTKSAMVNNIFMHYITRMMSCELVSLYWKSGTCGRFHSTLREECQPLAELLESQHGLGLVVTYVIPKLIFQRIFHFNTVNDFLSKKLLQGPQEQRHGESFTNKFKKDPTLQFLFLEAGVKTTKRASQKVKALSEMFFMLTFGHVDPVGYAMINDGILPNPLWPVEAFKYLNDNASDFSPKALLQIWQKSSAGNRVADKTEKAESKKRKRVVKTKAQLKKEKELAKKKRLEAEAKREQEKAEAEAEAEAKRLKEMEIGNGGEGAEEDDDNEGTEEDGENEDQEGSHQDEEENRECAEDCSANGEEESKEQEDDENYDEENNMHNKATSHSSRAKKRPKASFMDIAKTTVDNNLSSTFLEKVLSASEFPHSFLNRGKKATDEQVRDFLTELCKKTVKYHAMAEYSYRTLFPHIKSTEPATKPATEPETNSKGGNDSDSGDDDDAEYDSDEESAEEVGTKTVISTVQGERTETLLADDDAEYDSDEESPEGKGTKTLISTGEGERTGTLLARPTSEEDALPTQVE